MDCKTALGMLEAYLDAELDRNDARELEAHLDACAECRTALTRLDDLRRQLRDQALRHTAPPELRARIRQATAEGPQRAQIATGGRVAAADAIAAQPRQPRADSGRARALPQWTRLAAACVLAFGAGGLTVHWMDVDRPTASAQSQLARDLFASHWRALAAASPVDVVSSDQHTVKPWFAGKVAQSPLVRDFADKGFALVGGRLDYVGNARVAVLVYRHGQHLIDVYVLPDAIAAAIGDTVREQGYVIAKVKLGGQPAAIVSDTDAQELARFAGLLSTTH